MLYPRERGYGAMSDDLSGIGFECRSLEECKKYLLGSNIIAERIPVVCGFSIQFRWIGWSYLKYCLKFHKEYRHKTGKVVFDKRLTS